MFRFPCSILTFIVFIDHASDAIIRSEIKVIKVRIKRQSRVVVTASIMTVENVRVSDVGV